MGVREEENRLLLLKSSDLHYFLDLLDPILRVYFVVLGHVGDIGAQHCQGLAPTASHPYQKRMPEGCSDDSDNLDHVLNCHHEEHQVHFVGRVEVVKLLEIGLTLFLDCVSVGQFAVYVIIGLFGGVAIWVDSGDKAGPEEWLDSDETTPVSFEVGSYEVFEELVEELLVLDADQPILEDTRALMGPELDEV